MAADKKDIDPVLKFCAVGRQLGYAGYLSLDNLCVVRLNHGCASQETRLVVACSTLSAHSFHMPNNTSKEQRLTKAHSSTHQELESSRAQRSCPSRQRASGSPVSSSTLSPASTHCTSSSSVRLRWTRHKPRRLSRARRSRSMCALHVMSFSHARVILTT